MNGTDEKKKKTMLNCECASILIWCRKRQYFCPYFAGQQCDDYKPGEPKRAYHELLIYGPKEEEGD